MERANTQRTARGTLGKFKLYYEEAKGKNKFSFSKDFAKRIVLEHNRATRRSYFVGFVLQLWRTFRSIITFINRLIN